MGIPVVVHHAVVLIVQCDCEARSTVILVNDAIARCQSCNQALACGGFQWDPTINAGLPHVLIGREARLVEH